MSIQRYTVTEIDAFETLDQDAWCKGKDIAALELRVAELEAERNTLVETINAMNEVNTQLSHRLWCLENTGCGASKTPNSVCPGA